MHITPQQPYNFDKLLSILRRFPQPSLFYLDGDALYRTVDNGTGLVRIMPAGNSIYVETVIVPQTMSDTAIEQHITHIFGTDVDLSDFYTYTNAHAELTNLIKPLIGLPIERAESVFQALVFVIIEQHISWVSAQRAQRNLVEWGGNVLTFDGIQHYAMPTPQQLANATIDDLKPLKITFRRMQRIIDIAQQVVAGTLNLKAMLNLSPQAMYNDLLKIKGVGHWTASVVVSRARGIFPYVAHNDVALQAAVNRYFYSDQETKSAQLVTDTLSQYDDYAGLVAHFTLMRWVLDEYPVQK